MPRSIGKALFLTQITDCAQPLTLVVTPQLGVLGPCSLSFCNSFWVFFAVAPHYFSRNIVGQFTENRLPEKKLTTYIKYIIAPALYLQTQTIMGATKKKNTLKSAVSWTVEGWYYEDALWQPLNVWPHPLADAPPQLAHHRHAMWWLV